MGSIRPNKLLVASYEMEEKLTYGNLFAARTRLRLRVDLVSVDYLLPMI